MSSVERFAQRFDNFKKTLLLLEKACRAPIEDERDIAGIIQFYEMAIELSWKCMRDYLISQEFEDPVSPKASVMAALRQKIISSSQAEVWHKGLIMRNLTKHTYDEESARAIVEYIRSAYLPLLGEILMLISPLSK